MQPVAYCMPCIPRVTVLGKQGILSLSLSLVQDYSVGKGLQQTNRVAWKVLVALEAALEFQIETSCMVVPALLASNP